MTKRTDQSDNFGKLLAKLVQVPKAEADAEEAKWTAARKKLKAKGDAKGLRTRKQSRKPE